jgi:superfamily I DNA/RNA helicase/mRNA-degrading endonuclease RelE of RelBE toxin-antitoxin system
LEFRIADTFTDSLAKLTGDEQKAVKTTAFDLQLNPANPGMSFHKLDKAKDKNFWSVRVGSDIRLIVHKSDASLLLCYVGHHDKAYEWAARRKLETHPKTGAAQLVEIRETVKEVVVPIYVQKEPAAELQPTVEKKPIFAETSNDELLSYGVPAEWINDVKKANENTLLALTDHLPAEAAEALMELATGGKPRVSQPIIAAINPFDHPDAQRRFRVMTNKEELQRALDSPWEKWTIFLHPEQRQWVERDYGGPARVSGSAGTGKTIVALHRAVFLARTNPNARVLLTTFSKTLANALRVKLRRLISNEPRLAERLDVDSIDEIGQRLFKAHLGQAKITTQENISDLLKVASKEVKDHKFTLPFLLAEWEQVVDAWQLDTWEAYRDVVRLGRKTRLPEKQRVVLWSIFDRVRAQMATGNLITISGMFSKLAKVLAKTKNLPFDFAVVDESQDISVSHLRFFAALGADRPNSLFFAGDLGQRIFQQPFSWKELGIDIRGRARTLHVNYRTSHQIRRQADRLLAPEVSDVDGNTEERKTISVFNGPPPTIKVYAGGKEEIDGVSQWISERHDEGVLPHEFGVFVRSLAEMDRAVAAIKKSALAFKILDDNVETASGHVSITTMPLAKGLEFRAVVVMACDDEVIPLQARIESVTDDADLEEVYNTERHLLYVACTRARDHLLVTSIEPASEFLEDMHIRPQALRQQRLRVS